MRVKKTKRGFELIEFEDYNNKKCSLQQSSLALVTVPGWGCVWLGIDDHRMHLEFKQVKKLVQHLNYWIKENTFKTSINKNDDKGEKLK